MIEKFLVAALVLGLIALATIKHRNRREAKRRTALSPQQLADEDYLNARRFNHGV